MTSGAATLSGFFLAAVAFMSSAATTGITVGENLLDKPSIPLVDLQGRETMLQDEVLPSGDDPHATLLIFWATWCRPCVREIPDVNSLRKFYAEKDLLVLAVGLREGGDTPDNLMSAIRRYGVKYPVLFDSEGAVQDAFGIATLPMSVLIDRRGVIRWKGPALPRDINSRIRAMLDPPVDRGAR